MTMPIETVPGDEQIYDSGQNHPFHLFRWTEKNGWQRSGGWSVSEPPRVLVRLAPITLLRIADDEPTKIGAVVRDVDGELWVRLVDGRWACSHSEAQWSAIEFPVIEHHGATRVVPS